MQRETAAESDACIPVDTGATGSEHVLGDAADEFEEERPTMRIHALSALLPIALLTACAAGTDPAGDVGDAAAPATDAAATVDASEDVIVSTNEPSWQARVEGDTVILAGVDAPERRFTGARESMTMDGRRIDAADAAGEVVLIVRRMRCEDDMSGARFPMTGLLTIDGRGPFRGCARPASMPSPQPPGELVDDEASTLVSDRFLGRWDADAAACAGDGSDMALRVEPGALRYYGSVATPQSVLVLDDGDAVRITAVHEGEGERWEEERVLRLEGEDALVIEDDAGNAARRVRCE